MQLERNALFKHYWHNQDPFQAIEQLQGEIYRSLEARKTLRFEIEGQSFFIKIHRGIGWLEIIDNLLRLRLPVLGAKNEYDAIHALEHLKIDTMTIAAYGQKGWNPAQQQSFIITEDLINTISLEDYCLFWKTQKPEFNFKYRLIEKVAYISRTLHNNGINHRDYYICHFLMDISMGRDKLTADNIKLSLIDLHRAQIRKHTPLRWRVKDIGSLYYSAMDIGLTRRDFFRFMKWYDNTSLKQCLTQNKTFWQKVEQQGQKLWQRKQRKGDAIA